MYRSATYLALQNGLTEEMYQKFWSNYLNIRFHSEKAADGSQQVYVGDVDITPNS